MELHIGFCRMAVKEAFWTTEEIASSSKFCPRKRQRRLTLPCRSLGTQIKPVTPQGDTSAHLEQVGQPRSLPVSALRR